MSGNLNKRFGWLWIVIAPLMGMYITFQFQNVQGYGDSFIRTGNRLFHAHAGILAIFNILYGYAIDEVKAAENSKKLGSYLAIAGTILVSLSFFALLVNALGPIGSPSRILGFISILVSVLILISAQMKK